MTKVIIKTIQFVWFPPQERLAEKPSGVKIRARIRHSLGERVLSLFLSRFPSLHFKKNFVKLNTPSINKRPIEIKSKTRSDIIFEKKKEITTPLPIIIKFIKVIEITEIKGILIFEIP